MVKARGIAAGAKVLGMTARCLMPCGKRGDTPAQNVVYRHRDLGGGAERKGHGGPVRAGLGCTGLSANREGASTVLSVAPLRETGTQDCVR